MKLSTMKDGEVIPFLEEKLARLTAKCQQALERGDVERVSFLGDRMCDYQEAIRYFQSKGAK